MSCTIDDLPMVKASTLRAHGYIGPETKTTLIRFDDSGVEYQVGVTSKPLPCGAVWSLFICPRCNGRAQRLRLLDDRPACGKCVRASGLIYRSWQEVSNGEARARFHRTCHADWRTERKAAARQALGLEG